MTTNKRCNKVMTCRGEWAMLAVIVCGAFALVAQAGTGPRNRGPAAFIWDADNGMRDLTDLLIDEYDVDLGGGILNSVNGISADGTVMWGSGGRTLSNPGNYWRLTLDGETAIYEPLVELSGDIRPGLPRFTVTAMSRDGSTFVGTVYDPAMPSALPDAFVWSETTALVNLTDLTGGILDRASALSADGSIVAGRALIGTNETHAAIWSRDDGLTDLGDLPGGLEFGEALAISNDGSVVVGKSSSANSGTNPSRAEAFRWTEDTGMVGLGDPDGISPFNSRATVISGDGSLIGGVSVGGSFYTVEDGWVPFGLGANDISFDGTYMVGTGNFGQGPEAFLWSDEQGLLPLGDLPGDTFSSTALGVSDDGRIVVGTVSVPEPTALTILALAGIPILWRSRMRKRL